MNIRIAWTLIIALAYLLLTSRATLAQDALAQDTDFKVQLTQNEDGLYEFKKVFEVPGSADDLYLRVHQWIVRAYQSANHVIQLEDPDNHVIMAKGFSQTRLVLSGVNLWHILQIDTKDGRYRVTYSSFTYEEKHGAFAFTFEEKMPKKAKRKTEEYIKAALADLAKTMIKKADDW